MAQSHTSVWVKQTQTLAPRVFSQKTEGNKERAAPSEPRTFHLFLLNSANLPQIESLQLLPGSRQLN